jgi:hypothetical protein
VTGQPSPSTARVVVTFVVFQVCWLASVLGAAHDRAWLGPVCVAAFVAVRWAAVGCRAREMLAVAAGAALGYAADGLATAFGLLRFAGEPPLAPGWIAGLWIAFAVTLDCWPWRRRAVAALCGAVGGPLCYWAGARFGALQLGEPQWRSLTAIAAGWSGVLPAMLWVRARFSVAR